MHPTGDSADRRHCIICLELVDIVNNDFVFVSHPEHAFGEWVHLDLQFDFQNRAVRGFVDDLFFGEIPFFLVRRRQYDRCSIDRPAQQPALDLIVYVDNLSVSAAVPEPGTLSLMAVGLAGLLSGTAWHKSRWRTTPD